MSKVRNRARRNQIINPALRIRDFYTFGLQVLNEINFARLHPDEFLQKLEELNNVVRDDNCLYLEGIPFLYTDLKGSLEEAIRFLSKQKPLQGIIYNKTITQACDYLLDELIIHDGLDQDDSNKYNLETRLSKFGEPLGEIYELIDYGMFDPEFIVINFILCDGDTHKYERNVIFSPKIKYMGIASSILPSDKICTVINFCEDFYDKYQNIPLEVQMKYKKNVPQYNTKTIKNQQIQPKEEIKDKIIEKKNVKDEQQKVEDLENSFKDFGIKRKNSGKIYKMKRDQYIQRRNSLEQKNEEEQKKTNQQRGGIINLSEQKEPKDNISDKKDKNKDEKENEKDENVRDDGFVIKRKRTLHQPKLEVIEEEKLEDEDIFDREFKIESPEIINKMKQPKKPIANTNTDTTTTETKYIGDKKVTTTTTTKTEMTGDGQKKITTTTVTEEVGGEQEPPRYRNKIVKDIPFKSYGKKYFHEPNDEFNIEKEMKELEKNFDADFDFENFGFGFKSPIRPVFDPTDDMFEKEDDIEMPEGATSIEVKQKTITDSSGKPVLIVHKTITYENGEKKTFIEKQNIVKK